MMTTLILFQTILLTSLPSPQLDFNNNLSALPAAATPAALWEPDGAGRGKVIKESQKGKDEYRLKTVVIDAGHGGHDPGCLGAASQEKNIALAIAQQLGENLRERFPEVRVILTRDSDVFVPLHERARIANRNDADLFISIHCNAMLNSEPTHGSETYVMGLHTAGHNLEVAKRENDVILLEDDYEKNYDYDPNSPEGHIMLSMYQNAFLEQSILFAERVEEKINKEAKRRSRGVKQAGFVVLKETTMPSVLVETGFLTNRREEGYLNTTQGQQDIALSILSAFSEYKQLVEGFVQQPEAGEPVASPPVAAEKPAASPVAPADPFAGLANSGKPAAQPVDAAAPPRPVPAAQASQQPVAAVAQPPARPVATAADNSFGTAISVNSSPTWEATTNLQPRSTQPPPAAAAATSEVIQFCVQLAASPNPLNTLDAKWQNIRYQVEVVQEESMYKYQARNFKKLSEAMDARIQLRSNGFSDAFIVAYKGNQRISLAQARQELGE